jgi:hypothetical protein
VPGLPNRTSIRPGGRDQDEIVQERVSAKEDPWDPDKQLLEAEDFDADACERFALIHL